MPDLKHKNQNAFIINLRKEPVIANAVAPLPASVGGQPLAVNAGIGAAIQVFSNPAEDQRGGGSV